MSALGLQRVLGLGSYQTAWAWLHKLRRAMALPGRELLCGVIEVDESCRGASSRGRWPPAGRQGRDRRGGRHRARAGADQTDLGRDRDTLTGFVLDNVARGSEVRTDAWTGYDDIGRFHFSHVVTNMSGSGDPAHVALRHVHIVASLLKRLDPGHPPRLDQPPPARLLPRRVHLPL
jgi:hypothetical protein